MLTNRKKVLLDSREISSEIASSWEKLDFSKFVKSKSKPLGITRNDIADSIDVKRQTFAKIVNREQPATKRDCIIAICFVLLVGSGETCDALYMNDFDRLHDDVPRDNFLSTLLDEQEDKVRSISLINQCLKERGYKELDVIDDRKSRKSTVPEKPHEAEDRFVVKGIRVECRLDEQVFGDQYDSLATEYDPGRYVITSWLWLKEKGSGRDYQICAMPHGNYLLVDPRVQSISESFHTFQSLEETGDFRKHFENAQTYARQELRQKAAVLNDSKNYQNRISASVIDDSLHIYTETFNYSIPECQEYLFLDYSDGKFRFSVSKQSRFMEHYLSPEEYKSNFGPPKSEELFTCSSEEDFNRAIEEEYDYAKCAIMKWRLSAYHRMKNQITEFAKRLIGDTFIVNPELIIEHDIDLHQYFHIYDESQPWLEETDLQNGFTLGLKTLDQIQKFKEKNGSLEIKKILSETGLI